MNIGRATWLWSVVVIVASIAFAAWAAGRYVDGVDAASSAVADVAEAERLRSQILAARGGAGGGGGAVVSERGADFSRSLNDGLTAAGIDADHIAQVGAADSRPVAGSAFVERRSTVTLRGVTLPQAVTLVRTLDATAGLFVRDLRLAAPPRGDDDLWDLELTLSTLAARPAGNRDASARSGT